MRKWRTTKYAVEWTEKDGTDDTHSMEFGTDKVAALRFYEEKRNMYMVSDVYISRCQVMM